MTTPVNDAAVVAPVAGRTKPSAHTLTAASKCCWRGAHHDHVRSACTATRSRTGAASRAPRIDWGSTSPTRPPSARASSTASARNSTAASAYGPPPCRLEPPRVVAAAICDRYGGLPTTMSKPSPSHRCVSASAWTPCTRGSVIAASAPGSTSHPVSSSAAVGCVAASRSAIAVRKRPSPHAGSSTRTARERGGVNPSSTPSTTIDTSSGGVYQAPSSLRAAWSPAMRRA